MISVPMPLGPFLVHDGGRLAYREEGATPLFSFLWRSRCFTVKLSGGRMEFVSAVGRVPSTAAGVERRVASLNVLRALPQHVPAPWRLRLLPDHRLEMAASQPMEWPASVAALMTPIVSVLLHAAPVLDVLDEAGLGLQR